VLIAALCSVQFGLMADLEYYGLLNLPDGQGNPLAAAYGWNQVIYKIVSIMAACIVVAFLSSFLSEQTLSTRRELRIMEQQIKRVEKMAAIGEMAAGLAHEIKNPLASISGAIQLLREETRSDPDHDRLMQIILREAERLSSLVSNFLLYARPPAGKPETIDLERAVRETVELFEKKGCCGKPDCCHRKNPAGIWIGMDCAHLKQVLWNLLINAAEAIDAQGEIRVELSSAKNRQACLRISDTGAECRRKRSSPFSIPFSPPNRMGPVWGCRSFTAFWKPMIAGWMSTAHPRRDDF